MLPVTASSHLRFCSRLCLSLSTPPNSDLSRNSGTGPKHTHLRILLRAKDTSKFLELAFGSFGNGSILQCCSVLQLGMQARCSWVKTGEGVEEEPWSDAPASTWQRDKRVGKVKGQIVRESILSGIEWTRRRNEGRAGDTPAWHGRHVRGLRSLYTSMLVRRLHIFLSSWVRIHSVPVGRRERALHHRCNVPLRLTT